MAQMRTIDPVSRPGHNRGLSVTETAQALEGRASRKSTLPSLLGPCVDEMVVAVRLFFFFVPRFLKVSVKLVSFAA